jgi:TPP-dependent pyruvate/acetoin dehydrogenase alpha subunit
VLTEPDRAQFLNDVDRQVRAAVETAERTAAPSPDTLTHDVFAPSRGG